MEFTKFQSFLKWDFFYRKGNEKLFQLDIIVDFPFSNLLEISINFGIRGVSSSILFLATIKTTTEMLKESKFS